MSSTCNASHEAQVERIQHRPPRFAGGIAATPDNPRWLHVDVRLVKKTRLLGIPEMRRHPELAQMRVLAKGNRLSITPVEPAEWKFILSLL